MKIILDVFIIAVIALSTFVCYRKGFVKSLFSSFGFIAAVLLAILLTSPVSGLVDSWFMNDITRESMEEILEGVESNNKIEESVQKFENKNPLLSALLSNLGYDIGDMVEEFDNKNDLTSTETVDAISNKVSKVISNVFAFLISIVLGYIAFFILSKLFDLLSRIPVFNVTNKTLGLVFGIILGIFRASIYAIILSGIYPLVANIFSNDPAVINAVSDTYVLNFFIENNLIALLLKSIF